MKHLKLSTAAVLAAMALAPGLAHASSPGPLPSPPTYGAYVVAYSGPSAGVDPQVFQNGVLPTPAYNGAPGVLSASGFGGGVTASADLTSGDISIVANSTPGNSTEAIALIFTKLTFHGSGQGVVDVGGMLSVSGSAHAEEYVGVAPSLFLPEAGYSIPDASTWSASSTFNFFDGETLYAIAQLSGGASNGGSLSISDPMHFDMPTGTFFTADAPTFLIGSPTPEPGTWALMIGGLGLAGLGLRRRRAMVAA